MATGAGAGGGGRGARGGMAPGVVEGRGAGGASGVLEEELRGTGGAGVAERSSPQRGGKPSGGERGMGVVPAGERAFEAVEPQRRHNVVYDVAGGLPTVVVAP